MNIDKAKGISFTKRFEYLGDNVLLKRVLEISVECESLGTDISQVHSTIEGLSNETFVGSKPLRENISINGTSFGVGYIQSVTANPEGPDQQRKSYTVNIIIEEAGELDKAVQGISLESTAFIESISENYNISKDKKINNFSHEIEIKLNPSVKSTALGRTKEIADAIYKDTTKLESLLKSIVLPASFSQKKFKEVLAKGDKIVTIGGIHAKIMEMNDTTMIVESEGTKLKIDKSSVSMEASRLLNEPKKEEKK
jgi:preprotein translocase subunit YajC